MGVYCALSDPERRGQALASPSWDLTTTDGAPGFVRRYPDGVETTTYLPIASAEPGIEPLVLVRSFHGAHEATVELDQQFRLFHNLVYNPVDGNHLKPLDDGNELLAVKVEGNRISVRTSMLRQYLAARQMDLLLFIDSRVHSTEPADVPERKDYGTDCVTGNRYYGKLLGSDRYFTRYTATKVITPGPVESCGIWPFEADDDNYPEFVIGEDEDGRPVMHSCDPDLLANYFGKNPDAPDYLTPVHFRRDVLQKYYAKPELYSVEDGYLRCAGLWGVHIDNDHDDRVVVFLGDLGRDLPSAERDHWRGHMIPPDARMSDTNFKRAFLAQATEPQAVDLRFRRLYRKANDAWVTSHGWSLFREPKESDVYILQQLRLPLNDSSTEFEEAVTLLAKLMSDAINEKAVQETLENKVANEKGISKLKRHLEGVGYPHAERDIAYLRRVQELRSKVTAHLKGSDYEKALTKNVGDLRGKDAISELLEQGITFLTDLTAWCRTDAPTESTPSTEPKPADES
jgi:hypothetical protein